MTIEARNYAVIFSIILLIAVLFGVAGCAPSSSASTAVTPEPTPQSTASSQPIDPSTTSAQKAPDQAVKISPINVVVAGYIDHGPLQPTVRAIKDVLSKYGDKVTVTWVDLSSQQGQDYFKEHQLSAHMNVIINGTSQYEVNGRSVDFQWFEGQQWTRQDLDTVLAGLADK